MGNSELLLDNLRGLVNYASKLHCVPKSICEGQICYWHLISIVSPYQSVMEHICYWNTCVKDWSIVLRNSIVRQNQFVIGHFFFGDSFLAHLFLAHLLSAHFLLEYLCDGLVNCA